MTSFDQYALTASASGELIVRSVVRLETAVAGNPKSPDFSGLDVMLLSTPTESGGAVTAGFHELVANQQKSQATIWKQGRLFREEKAAELKRKKGDGKGKATSDHPE